MQTMGDENHGNTFGSHAANGAQKRLGLLLGQNGRRLVQDQEL